MSESDRSPYVPGGKAAWIMRGRAATHCSLMFSGVVQFLGRHRWVVPLVSFLAGWASFVFVQRGASLAIIIAFAVLAGWIWLFIQPCIQRSVERFSSPAVSTLTVNFVAQSIQQEILFFSLPFLFFSTVLNDPGQVIVTASVVLAAVLSTIDPLYERCIACSQLLRLGFHSLCSFVAALVILPIVVRIPVESSFNIAMGFVILWLLLATPFIYTRRQQLSLGLLMATLVFPVFVWTMRAHIPPAGIQVMEATLTSNVKAHDPVDSLHTVARNELDRGLYVHAAIRAPLGLSQAVIFEWRHDDTVDIVPSVIVGGRTQGFRTFSRKENFGSSPLGDWEVHLRTPQGQLLERVRFTVVESGLAGASTEASAASRRLRVTGLATNPAMKSGSAD